jgi:hypothetical protein
MNFPEFGKRILMLITTLVAILGDNFAVQIVIAIP